MELYHYTSCAQLQQILADGYIKLTNSNLRKPVNPHWEISESTGALTLADETDSIKPVVWLTDLLDFGTAEKNGLQKQKTEVAIVITVSPLSTVERWESWADRNGIDKGWKKAMMQTAPHYKHWYISETPIKITNETRISFRPDIAQKFMEDQQSQ